MNIIGGQTFNPPPLTRGWWRATHWVRPLPPRGPEAEAPLPRSSKGFTVLKEDLRKAGSRLGARDAGKGEASRRLRRVSRCNPTGSGSMSPLPGLHIQEWGAVIRMLSHPGGR
ncbi:hypothetical protein B0H12DRAFT_1069817 [Mycena haematopus]|nr:hypothetical protein B0H12DRAFT_1069817 [Mycena haematopus]